MRSDESPNIQKCQCKNCFLSCYTAIRRYRMSCRRYPLLYQAYKVILTFSVTPVSYERSFSKRRYVKNRLRNQLGEDAVVVVYPTPSKRWGHGGRSWSPRSRATFQDLDQRSYRNHWRSQGGQRGHGPPEF